MMPEILECKSVSNKSTISGNNMSPGLKSKSDIKDLYREISRKSGFSQKTPVADYKAARALTS